MLAYTGKRGHEPRRTYSTSPGYRGGTSATTPRGSNRERGRGQVWQTGTPPTSTIRKGGMLLEVWSAGTQSLQLPQPTQTVLLLVRQGGHSDPRMSVPDVGKRKADRADQTCSSVRETHSTDPRPFIQIKVGRNWTTALVDPGSVRSYLDQKHAEQCRREGWEIADSGETAIMADGAIVDLGGRITGTITAAN